MREFVFTKYAKKRFVQLEQRVQDRIIEKLRILKTVENLPLKKLHDMDPATHRLRIGPYRLILKPESEQTVIVLDIGHRKDIYKSH
ncbi:MAG: type II toxin-antitoxin system RelE/ParE family toxin [Candidatus Magasanikbacteria bacterium CG_4_9_14_0_2_um_filter_42_11]|uniref:Type II toxin-antitoxin system RelE/ParE family toxin n=1 Tax=Candidatus Magasanikbacteria bacterium CG_4_9_14_0_2_um_filter_42_11 TaxID=1974643 RepID=A0A2M8F8S7_9BACT|nr:MAG: type II toxin-antitoxin system RelE/ParE family toxin [Candidatus Magasanikbacteria bacterium CG10_big_fil_rev_8_21_14_0_10_43_9]PIY92669.1 MAG: type II toxin-antitoxin system RelE/ParE family toxin [Candidatus Magasanikbacteria bacterium CG_4_10_14_0_8_um_filter_42_12]PJC52121.1 MAG: type II toxin-antitoxin system RelE/ParE family toxin [Candidatus Magasanikbacteria bacterium CG_4_9_14_0_2_um_filter_42_11]